MHKHLEGALVASAAALGYNWIYNVPYLKQLSEEKSLVFQKADKNEYERAGKAFYAYPFSDIGDVSAQGEILKWLLRAEDTIDQDGYLKLIYDKVKPGGYYRGWVESYAKKLVVNRYIDILKLEVDQVEIDDDQLIGFVPYFVAKKKGKDNDWAYDLASGLTKQKAYRTYYDYFDAVLESLKTDSMRNALEKHLDKVPKAHLETIKKGFVTENVYDYIGNPVNTACHIPHAVPLILHLLYHGDAFETVVERNTVIGGASSDRGLLLGFIAAAKWNVPDDWLKKTRLK